MDGATHLLFGLGLAFFTSLAFTGFMVLAGVSDVPNSRSAHIRPIATAGGVGLVAGLGAGLLYFSHSAGINLKDFKVGPILSLIFAAAMLGLIDDIHTLSPRLKLCLIALLAGLAVWLIGPPQGLRLGDHLITLPVSAAFIGAVLWLFTVTNAVNFMDGSNGLMGLVMTLASFIMAGVAIATGAPKTALLFALLAATIIGFLPYNFRRKAQVFCGDVGALFAGFSYGSLVLLAAKESGSAMPIFAGPLLILPFLADVLLTMLVRARMGQKIWQAHNLHMYQRVIRSGRSHMQVAWFYGLMTLIIGNAIFLTSLETPMNIVWLLGGGTTILSIAYIILHKKLPI